MATTPEAVALAVIEAARQGRFDDGQRYTPPLQAMVPPETLRAAQEAGVARHGPVISAGDPASEPTGPVAVAVRAPVRFERGTLTAVVSLAGERHGGTATRPGTGADRAG